MKSDTKTELTESLNSVDLSVYSNEELRELISKAEAVISDNPFRDFACADITLTIYKLPGYEITPDAAYLEIMYDGETALERYGGEPTLGSSLAIIPLSSLRSSVLPALTADWVEEAITLVKEYENK